MAKKWRADSAGRIKFLIAIMLLAMSVAGIQSAAAGNRLVTVGVYENSPKIFTDESGKPAGVFIDVIENIAQAEGWNLRYVSGTWGEGLDRLKNGEIDLMPDVAYTPAREEIYAFHRTPVLSSWYQVYARKGSGIRSILDLSGKRIVVLERSVQQDAFARLSGGFGLNATIISLADYRATFELVARGEADAAVANRFYGLRHAAQFGLEDTAVMFEPSDLFFAAKKGENGDLLSAIDARLVPMKKDPGSIYHQSLKRWTMEKIAVMLPGWIRIACFLTGGIILFITIWSFLLKRQIKARTRDLSERNEKIVAANRALASSERKYRELLEHANSIILHWTSDGRITFLNEFGQRFFGFSQTEIVGRHVVGTIVPDVESGGRDLKPLMDKICVDPKAFERNVNENIRRNGERVWISWTNKVYFDDNGRIEGILSIGTDITEQRRVEEELRRLNLELEQRVAQRTVDLAAARDRAESADRLKSAFLAVMSHELRTPLNSIIGFTGILLQELAGPLNPEQRKQMGMVQASARHLLALINDVLDISKIEAGQLDLFPTSFDLKSSMEKSIALVTPLAEKKGIDLKLDIAENVDAVTMDQRRLEQVIINLLNNAVKFTEKGYVLLSCRNDNDHYAVSVSDTGIGIRDEAIPALFQPFHQVDNGLTRKHEGTGLGLSISKKLIEMMGGTIKVQSQWGKGSTFTIRLPKGMMNAE
ncbi:MAG: ATP-binding protein [Thermodesulfobacteriota bacterium]